MSKVIFYKTSSVLYDTKTVDNEIRRCKNLIYIARNKDGKIYIGETKQEFQQRIKSHIRKKYTDFEQAIGKENMDDFEWGILEKGLSNTKKRFERERYYIQKYDSLNKGFNLTKGGKGTKGYKHNDESIEANRKRKIEYYENEANRKKQSTANFIAHTLNPQQRKKHSSHMKNLFDEKTLEGQERREKAALKQKNYFKENQVQYVLNYKKPPFFAYKDGMCIGVFISQAECSRMLGVDKGKLSSVLNNKRLSTNGYTFKYFDKTGYLFSELLNDND